MTYGPYGTGAPTQVSVAATSTLVVPANPKRIKLTLSNDSANTIYVCKWPIATAYGVRVGTGATYIMEPDPRGYIYKGQVTAIAPAGASNLNVTEENSG